MENLEVIVMCILSSEGECCVLEKCPLISKCFPDYIVENSSKVVVPEEG